MNVESAREFFEGPPGRIGPERARSLDASYRFEIEGGGTWRVEVRAGVVTVEQSQEPADCMIATDEQTFLGVVQNQLSPIGAFMTGKIRVEGDMGLALRLRDLIG